MTIFYKNPKFVKIISNTILILSLMVLLFSLFMFVVGGSVFNEFNQTLIEVRKLENDGLINNLPSTVSDNARYEIKAGNNSYDIEKYISDTEIMLVSSLYSAIISAIIILMIIILKILFRYKRALYDFFSKK